MPYFTTKDKCHIYYETPDFDTAKPVIVFLNGTMQNTLHWKTQAFSFKDRFRVMMYDARAQGKSDLGELGLSLERHISDLTALLEHVGVERAHLVGLSHGARVALAYAVRSPERVDRVVLCSVNAVSTRRARLTISSWLKILETSGLETLAWAILPVVFGESYLRHKQRILDGIVNAMVSRNNKQALMAHLEALMAYPPLSQMAKDFRIPCLVLSGSDDPLVSEEGAGKLAALLGGRHKHLTGIGHSIPFESPELFNKTVMEFLCKK